MTTAQEAGWGAFWGSLIGALIAIPFTAGARAAVLAGTLAAGVLGGGALGATGGALDARWWKDEFGVPEEFAKGTGSMLRPGDSEILAILQHSRPGSSG